MYEQGSNRINRRSLILGQRVDEFGGRWIEQSSIQNLSHDGVSYEHLLQWLAV